MSAVIPWRLVRGFAASTLLVLLSGGATALAQLEESSVPRFLIETLTVENAERISPDIVLSESLLEEGNEYTEDELRDAVHRIVRLPFIVDADFALRKGTERGLYELVIHLEETRRWFFGLDVRDTYWEVPISVSGLGSTDVTEASTALFGRRWAVGSQGLFFLAVGGANGTLTAGYQQFDLFDRDVFLSTSFSLVDCSERRLGLEDPGENGCKTEVEPLGLDPTGSTWSFGGDGVHVEVAVGVPLEGNRSLRFRTSARRVESGIRRSAFDPVTFQRFDERKDLRVNVSWVLDSVDDPVFPGSGKVLEAGIDARILEAEIDRTRRLESAQVGLLFAGRWYRPWGRRDTLWLGADAFVGASQVDDLPLLESDEETSDETLGVFQTALSLGHSRYLVNSRRQGRVRDVRWENELRIAEDQTSPDLAQADNPFETVQLSSGIAYRNRWGVFRYTLSYVAVGQR
jgi:hypothetical protein